MRYNDVTPFPSKKASSTSGFSLVELMIVVALIAIIGMFAAPDIMTFRPNTEVRSATNDAFAHLQNAKMAALRENRNCAITFGETVDGVLYDYAIYLDENLNFAYNAGERVISKVNVADNLEKVSLNPATNFALNDTNNPTIAFQPNGIPIDKSGGASNGSLFIDGDGSDFSTAIIISKVGNIHTTRTDK